MPKEAPISIKPLDLRQFIPRGTSRKQFLPQHTVMRATVRRETHVAEYDIFNRYAANLVADNITMIQDERLELNKDVPPWVSIFITPGHTMQGFLEELAKLTVRWEWVKMFNVVELSGISPANELSFSRYLPIYFFERFPEDKPQFPLENFYSLQGNEHDATAFDKMIDDMGGFDIGVLGIGRKGDIGMNMPGTSWGSRMGKVEIPKEMIVGKGLDYVVQSDPLRPSTYYAWSIGMRRIFETRHLFLLAFGNEKREIVRKSRFLTPGIHCPASMLQIHPKVDIILDGAAAGMKPQVAHSPDQAANMFKAADILDDSLSEEHLRLFSEVIYTYLDLLPESLITQILKGFKGPLSKKTPEEMETYLQTEIFNYYISNMTELMHSVPDKHEKGLEYINERLKELFEHGIRVAAFPAVRGRVLEIKFFVNIFIIGNIRDKLSKIGSQQRSNVCKDLLHTHIFHSNDIPFLRLCVEAMVELLAIGESDGRTQPDEQNNQFILWLSEVAASSGNIFNLAQLLAGVLLDIKKGTILPFQIKDRADLLERSMTAVAKFVACDEHLAKQFLTYMNSLSQNNDFTALCSEMNERVMEHYKK